MKWLFVANPAPAIAYPPPSAVSCGRHPATVRCSAPAGTVTDVERWTTTTGSGPCEVHHTPAPAAPATTTAPAATTAAVFPPTAPATFANTPDPAIGSPPAPHARPVPTAL
ncbi:hypothetical protein GCM10010302_14660 [Streptomyces polychromogenes]|uniref:Uncharacterized protein n=1 Tax=Streptomyces polychromogenes TaxID=67342 RepID=A0ABP3EUP2_9ACTN